MVPSKTSLLCDFTLHIFPGHAMLIICRMVVSLPSPFCSPIFHAPFILMYMVKAKCTTGIDQTSAVTFLARDTYVHLLTVINVVNLMGALEGEMRVLMRKDHYCHTLLVDCLAPKGVATTKEKRGTSMRVQCVNIANGWILRSCWMAIRSDTAISHATYVCSICRYFYG